MVTRWIFLGLVGLIAAQRAIELRRSQRNAAWALGQGGIEVGRGQLPFMVALHAGFLISCALEVVLLRRPFNPLLAAPMLVLLLCALALRLWAIGSLGRRWSIRVIAIPGAPAVQGGPYRYLRHPNYLAVVVEGFAIPLLHSAWLTAIGFTVLNAWLLAVRIPVEERLLERLGAYPQRQGDSDRLLPRRPARGHP